jgi:hypothetical protein
MYRLVERTALDNGETDLIFTQAQLERMSNTMIRRLAAASRSDEINGKSVKLEIYSYFCGQHTLTEYAQ